MALPTVAKGDPHIEAHNAEREQINLLLGDIESLGEDKVGFSELSARTAEAIDTLDSDLDLKLTEKYGTFIKVTDKRFGAKCRLDFDSGPAINSAITYAAAAQAYAGLMVVLLPKVDDPDPLVEEGYASSVAIVERTGVTLRGENRVLLKKTGASVVVFINATNMDRCSIEGLTIDPAGLASAATVRASGTTTRMRVKDCKFIDSVGQPAAAHAFEAQAGTDRVWVEECHFDGLPNNIRITATASRCEVRRNRFTNWSERCIYVIGSSAGCSTNTIIDGNEVTEFKTGGSVRQPITFQGTTDGIYHQSPKVLNNIVLGPNKSYTAADPGTADQISLHRCQDFEVRGNTSKYGGDVGITISVQCRRGTIADNISCYNDSYGIAIGATGANVKALAALGNILMNNGQNRNGDRTDRARVGIALNTCSDILVQGNTTGDDQDVKKQRYGYSIRDTTNVTFGTNNDKSNEVGVLYTDIGNVGTVTAATDAASGELFMMQTAEVTLPQNDNTLYTDIPGMSLVLATGTYLIEGYIEYEAPVTTDCKVKFSAPGSTGGSWASQGLQIGATSSVASIQKVANGFTASATLGGTGGPATATPVGILVVTASGTFKLQATQGTAEAFDVKVRNCWLTLKKKA